jgi:hypothetical protein
VGLGLLALFAAGLRVSALFHGVVLAALPADVVRAAISLALVAGAAAAAAGCALLIRSGGAAGTAGRRPRASVET